MNKFYSMLGIGKKAGYIVGGETACIALIKKKKCTLLILAKDASNNTKDKFSSLCKKFNIKCILIGEKEVLGKCIGKDLISTLAVSNQQFSENLLKIINKVSPVNNLGGE